MASRNDRSRKRVRSSKKKCKPGGRWTTWKAAEKWIERFAEKEPLKALGLRPYPCEICGFFHVGRGQRS